MASRGWQVYGKAVWQNPRRGKKLEAKKEINEEATKIDSYAIARTVKSKYKLVPVVVGHIWRFTKYFLNYGGRIEMKVFSWQHKPSPIPSAGLKIPLVIMFSISEEKSAILKHLPNLIDLNYKELTSMDTPQNEVILEEELGKEYNTEDEDIVFTDDDSESNSDYDTLGCIYHSN